MYNAHGDVTALINTTGAVVATYDYDAFGTITEKTGTVNNSITYAGYQYDAESDMYYLNARYYDSKIARFMTEDTYRGQANDPLSLNLYSYVSNNPVRYYDPTGHTLMTVGSSGTEVAKMQGMLIQAGYNLGSSGADGKFGNKTLAAIKDFQNKTGCTVDGKVGNQTMTVLAAAVKAPLSAGVDLKNVAANAKTGGLTTSIVAPNKGQTNQTLEVKKINTTPTPPKVPILPKPAAALPKPSPVVAKATNTTVGVDVKSIANNLATTAIHVGDQVIRGSAAGDDATVVDMLARVGMSVVGADLHLDVIDLGTSIENWKYNDIGSYGQIGLNTLALVPIVGVVKQANTIGDIGKIVGKNIDGVVKGGSSLGKLKPIGNHAWESTNGLIYEQGSKQGNRVLHILEHTVPDPSKPLHTVFNVGKNKVLGVVDEAWSMRESIIPILQKNGNQQFDIPMGKIVGTNGETTVRIIVENGTSKIVTSFPVK